MKKIFALTFGSLIFASSVVNADMISEFEPSPLGSDPSTTSLELFGDANTGFDLNLIFVENDGINGVVDSAFNVTGTYDSQGLAVVTFADPEDPSFTLLLTEFIVAETTDLDPTDSGSLDLSSLGTIFDAVGISDSVSDNATLYSNGISNGSSIFFNGFGEPHGVFRDASNGDFFQFVTNDGSGNIGVYSADGVTQVDPSEFSFDPTTTSYGSINPSLSAVPEPSTFAILGLAGLGLGVVRRRKI
jgi:hypothetical protein